MINDWNRKDLEPSKTVEIIRNILSTYGIDTVMTEENDYKGLWFSNRIEITGLPIIGTNGKGVTKEYALASAYGEFMERLQSGFLINNLFRNKQTNSCKQYCFEDLKKLIKKYFTETVNNLDESEIDELTRIVESRGLKEYYSFKSNEIVNLPDYYISFLCGSNGIAAGNTYEEAFAQGLSEIFERYVIQYIYKENYTTTMFSIIDETTYINTNSYALLSEIRERGYYPYLIDCSLGGKLPVIGILVFDPSKAKYFFKLGSDINMDICIQRCITEIFQGVSFDLNFKLKMVENIKSSREGSFWFEGNMQLNHIKAETDGTGRLPRGFLNCLNNRSNNILPFIKKEISNKEAALELLNRLKHISSEMLVADYSHLGFPAIRIFIPNVCESFYYTNDNTLEPIKAFNKALKLFKQNNINNISFLNCLVKILEYNAYKYEFNMIKLFGIIVSDLTDIEYLYDPYLFVALLALHLKEFDIAFKYLGKSSELSRRSKKDASYDEVIFEAISKKVTYDELISYFKLFKNKNSLQKRVEIFYKIYENGFSDINCTDCKSCVISEKCQYNNWIKIYKNLELAKDLKGKKNSFFASDIFIEIEKNMINGGKNV